MWYLEFLAKTNANGFLSAAKVNLTTISDIVIVSENDFENFEL